MKIRVSKWVRIKGNTVTLGMTLKIKDLIITITSTKLSSPSWAQIHLNLSKFEMMVKFRKLGGLGGITWWSRFNKKVEERIGESKCTLSSMCLLASQLNRNKNQYWWSFSSFQFVCPGNTGLIKYQEMESMSISLMELSPNDWVTGSLADEGWALVVIKK